MRPYNQNIAYFVQDFVGYKHYIGHLTKPLLFCLRAMSLAKVQSDFDIAKCGFRRI